MKIDKWAAIVLGLVAGIYLLNLGFGVVELIPDNIPLFGQIDEIVATAILLWSLEKFGIKIV